LIKLESMSESKEIVLQDTDNTRQMLDEHPAENDEGLSWESHGDSIGQMGCKSEASEPMYISTVPLTV